MKGTAAARLTRHSASKGLHPHTRIISFPRPFCRSPPALSNASSSASRSKEVEETSPPPPPPHLSEFRTHATRTSVTSLLWERRMKVEEEQLKRFGLFSSKCSTAEVGSERRPSFLVNKTPSDSIVGARGWPDGSLFCSFSCGLTMMRFWSYQRCCFPSARTSLCASSISTSSMLPSSLQQCCSGGGGGGGGDWLID